FAADVGAAAQGRDDLAVLARFVAGLELAANDTGLAPDLSRREFAVGGQAGQFGAGAGAAGRAVVGLAGAEHEVAAVGVLVGAEKLDVVDAPIAPASDALGFQGLADGPGVIREGGPVGAGHDPVGRLDQEEPVAAPGDVAV